jgi:hypothetical protein
MILDSCLLLFYYYSTQIRRATNVPANPFSPASMYLIPIHNTDASVITTTLGTFLCLNNELSFIREANTFMCLDLVASMQITIKLFDFTVVEEFNAVQTTSSVGSVNAAVVFNTIISVNHSLDSSCTFLGVTSSPTVYWMHIGALVPALGQVNLTLTNGQMTLVKTIAANTTLDDTVTMTGVVDFASGAAPTQLSIISSQPMLTVNWAGFRIDTYNNPFVAFRVASSASQILYLK